MSNESVSIADGDFEKLWSVLPPVTATPLASPPGSPGKKKRELTPLDRLGSIKNPIIPSTRKKPETGPLIEMFAPLRMARLVTSLGALPRDVLDTRAKDKKSGSLTTNVMTFTNFGKDHEIMTVFRQAKIEGYSVTEVRDYIEALENSTLYIGSSGNMFGLVNRLVTGMISSQGVSLKVKECVKFARSCISYEQVTYDYRNQSVTPVVREFTTSSPKLITLNKLSSAGIPLYGKIGDPGAVRSACDTADMLLDAMGKGTYTALVSGDRRALLGVMLKNKQDFYKLSLLEDKIRPYFVYPLHERFMYSALQASLKPLRFDQLDKEGPRSSAVGFSWNYGGGDRLYHWISRERLPGSFSSIFYGDDQLWVFTLIDGTVYIATPDFSHMDLSLAADWGHVAFQVWRPYFGDMLDKTWEGVLKLNCFRAFTRPVVVDGPVTFQFNSGLGSGIPGTTKFDEVASAAVNGYVKAEFESNSDRIANKAELRKWLVGLGQAVKNKFGLTFKEDSFDLHLFERNQNRYSFVFLGQSLQKIHGASMPHYVPVPDLKKLMISATTYKKNYRGNELKQRSSMHKFRSLYASGGIHYPIFGNQLRAMYESLRKRKVTPINDSEDDYSLEVEGSAFVQLTFEDDEWPTDVWVNNLYLPLDDPQNPGVSVSNKDRHENPETELLGDLVLPDFDKFGLSEDSTSDSDTKTEKGEVEIDPLDDMFTDPGPSSVSTKPPMPFESLPSKSDPEFDALVEGALKPTWGYDEDRSTAPSGKVLDMGKVDISPLPRVEPSAQHLIQSKYSPAQKQQFKDARQAERDRLRAEKLRMVNAAKDAALSRKGRGKKKASTSKLSRKEQLIAELAALDDQEDSDEDEFYDSSEF